jgi:calcium-binding protein CML
MWIKMVKWLFSSTSSNRNLYYFILGSISRAELRSLCYDLGYYLSDDELTWAWTIIDKDGSGMIDYREFAEWWKTSSRFEHLKMPNEQQTLLLIRVAEICRSYDKINIGTLDRTQFTALCQTLIQEGILNANEYQACSFDEIDRSHDGRIHFNELIAWLKNIGILNNGSIENS